MTGGQSARELHATVCAHLDGLATWGISRLRFPTGAAAPAASESAATPSAGSIAAAPAVEASVDIVLSECAREVASCQRCRLHETRRNTVFGAGDTRAELMFVGEAPGADEDARGEPFVGKAGQLLDKIILAMGLRREDVYIANVLKCRPPGNRNPLADEVASCTGYLRRQIEAIAPRIIVALGRPASNFLLDSTSLISSLRGRLLRYRDTPLVATYHPAYLLREPAAKRKTWQDLQLVIEYLGLTPPHRAGE